MLSKEDLAKAIGVMLRKHREEKGISMETLAFDTGIEFRQLGRIERGEISTTIYSIYRITIVLEINLIDIVKLSD